MTQLTVRPDAATGKTTAKSNSKTFSPYIDAKEQAYDLLSRCIHNTIKGRICGEIIPYYFCTVCYDYSYGLGISFHYDSKIGLRCNIHTVDKTREHLDNDYSDYLNYANEVKQWVDYYMECCVDDDFWGEICEAVDKHQITKVEAKEKTNWLFNNNSIMYV